MPFTRISLSTVILSAVVVLSACGGGSDADSSPAKTASAFAAKLSSGLAALATSSGLTSMAVPDLFDAKYLDVGFTKADLLASLSATSQALGTNPELSLFPMAQVTNATLTGCDSNSICTLNATLTNSDADTTAVDFSTKVKVVGDVVYLYGDQSSTASI